MNKSLITALCLCLFACHGAPNFDNAERDRVTDQSFPQSSLALSKWVRSNVEDFWSYERKQNPLSEFADAEGIVVGDTHLANFAPIPVRLTDGTTQMRYLDIDFDDAGRAPFAYDLLRLVVTTKATKTDVKVKEIVDAYVRGLTGGTPVSAPIDLQENLSMTSEDYRKQLSKDIDSKTSAGKFRMKPGKIEPYQGPFTMARAAALLPDFNVLDLALRPADDATDDGQSRVWIYVKDSAGKDRMFELKKYVPTRLAAWGTQAEAGDWFDEVRANLWPSDVARGEYELVNIDGMGTHWLREKKLTLIDIPYSSQDKKSVAYVRSLANYDAYVLGQLHAQQASSVTFATKLRNPVQRGAFEELVKVAAQDYLTSVESRIH